jgi:hypothetical protein
MSSITVIPDDDDEFYATFDLDGVVAQAKSQSQSLGLRSQLRTTLFDLFGYSEVKPAPLVLAEQMDENFHLRILYSFEQNKQT